MNALIATTSKYTRLTTDKKVDGTVYSCTSFGTIENAAVQPDSCLSMLHVMYLWLPMIFNLLITIILVKLNVEKANDKLKTK